MIAGDGTIAHWLGETVDGKRLHEPVNVILVDEGATSADHAKQRLVAASAAARFPVVFGHSTGYRGFIDGELYGQLPQGRDDAFSIRIFEESNNHGRVFGPHRFDGGYLFIAAFSRERVILLERPGTAMHRSMRRVRRSRSASIRTPTSRHRASRCSATPSSTRRSPTVTTTAARFCCARGTA